MDQKLKKILIIDDDDRNIFALKAVLSAKKFTCITATGGQQAIDLMTEQKGIDAALVDMMMPGMDGYELMGILRNMSVNNKMIIVAVTAQAMPGDKEKCIEHGADAYIAKPVDIDKLMEILNNRSTVQ